MPFLGSLPENANLGRLYTTDPAYFMPLVEFSENVMRGPSPLSPGQREFIAAYVSGLNACALCAGAHQAAASAFEIDSDVFAELMEDIETARVDENIKPILRYTKKLTLTPSRLVQADADAVFDAGWDGRGLVSRDQRLCAVQLFQSHCRWAWSAGRPVGKRREGQNACLCRLPEHARPATAETYGRENVTRCCHMH